MSQIKQIKPSELLPNPHRSLDHYPYIERKIVALRNSYRGVGVWEGVIARKAPGGKYELAFGHHRVEAARRSRLRTIPVVVKPLSDEEMLEYMGRENMEDYNADFTIMMNTWEGAVGFLYPDESGYKAIGAAKVLGWTSTHSKMKSQQMNDTARACHSAHGLIQKNYLSLNDLEGLTVKQAQEISERASKRMEQMDKMGKATNRPKAEVEESKKHVARGAKSAAKKVKKGTVASKDIRGAVDTEAFKSAASSKVKQTPLFARFGQSLVESIEKMLDKDSVGERLTAVQKALNKMTMEDDFATIRRINFELAELSKRSEKWQKKLIPTSKKVQQLMLVQGGKK